MSVLVFSGIVSGGRDGCLFNNSYSEDTNSGGRMGVREGGFFGIRAATRNESDFD